MFFKTNQRRAYEGAFSTSELSWSLDFELELIQQNRIAHLKRLGAKAQRLAHLNGVEPSNVSKTLDELVRIGAKAWRLEHLNGVEPSNVSKSLDELVLMRSAQLDAELEHMQEIRRQLRNREIFNTPMPNSKREQLLTQIRTERKRKMPKV